MCRKTWKATTTSRASRPSSNSLNRRWQQIGVERIKTVGEHFDPHLHEAVGIEEGDGKHEIISEELQAGYRLGDEVIRHAMVKVKG